MTEQPAMFDRLQKSLARHALGLPNKRRTSWRNHFVGPVGPDLEAWNAMVAAGDAREGRPSALTGGDAWFCLTKQGATKALQPREKLDAQEFPELPT